jgi:energy-coupling factor transporter ATP-binding protein EcfA2
MSTATPEATHSADRHDLIRVQGARVNNLRDVSVEIPKRRLTVFTGVSGSGKSSLVFGTIAAESQRMINETYSTFLQNFMPSLARPEVDVLEGLTTAIIVDQERMGANARSTVGTAPTPSRLPHLFSRLDQPHIGSPQASSFNVASIQRDGRGHPEKAGRRSRSAAASASPAGCAPVARGGGGQRHRPLSRCTTTASRSAGALTIPATPWKGWYGRIFTGCGFFDPTSRSATSTRRAPRPPSQGAHQDQGGRINLTYEGLIPKIQKSMLAKDVDSMQPHIRAFVERAVTFTTCPDCGGTRSARGRGRQDRGNQHRRRLPHADQRSGRWVRGLDEPPVAPLLTTAPADARLVRGDRAGLTCRSTGRRARCRAARGSA